MKTSVMAVAVVACVLVSGVAVGQPIIVDSDTFPVPGGTYLSAGGTQFTGSIPTELGRFCSMFALPGDTLPLLNKSPANYQVDSFFDVFCDLRIDGSDYQIESFFDVFFDITVPDNDGITGTFQAEIVEMSLDGNAGGHTVQIRESPSLESTGQTTMTDLGDDTFQVESFFDVFTELSVDGGEWVAAEGPVRLNLVPEPATSALLLVGMACVLLRRRKRA